MGLKAQPVQSIGNFVLVRIYNPSNGDGGSNGAINHEVLSKPESECGGGTSVEQATSHEVSSWVVAAARLLQRQWPRQDRDEQQNTDSDVDKSGTDDDSYYRKFVVHHEKSCPRYSLACSYILLKSQNETKVSVVGHGRLTECYESAGGNAVAFTYILIDAKYRGKGHGKTLLCLMEQEAKSKERLRCDYHFVYLWCKATTAPFYEKYGYQHSKNRVSLQRPCLKALTATSVQSIEDTLLRRRRHPFRDKGENSTPSAANTHDNETVTKKLETIVLLPSDSKSKQTENDMQQSPKEDDVWLRKRLVDHVESVIISEKDRRIEIQEFVSSTDTASTSISNHFSTNTIVDAESDEADVWHRYRWNPHVPWQMQIGPTCGLTAIRMIGDFYGHSNTPNKDGAQTDSLLVNARTRGYTDDGEMFDADQLRDLMMDQLLARTAVSENFLVKTRDTSSMTIEEMDSIIQKGGLWILPYDSNPRTKIPGNFRGMHAHWGIVVGILYFRTKEPNDASTSDTTQDVSSKRKTNNEELGINDLLPADCSPFLIVQHSLASKWVIAPMLKWFDSNRQLSSVNKDKFALGNNKRLNLSNKVIQVVPT